MPPGLLRRMLADPAHVAEHLAASAVERFADRAERDVRLIRERNPDVTDRQLAVYFKQKYSRAARWEGAGSGAAGVFGLPADLALLGWIQNRLVLSIAATYGHDMSDHTERAVELLMIQGIHNSREVARAALTRATRKAVTKLVVRHLRKRSLVVVKQLFRVVGINFTRKAFVENGIPLVSIPLSAVLNDLSTRYSRTKQSGSTTRTCRRDRERNRLAIRGRRREARLRRRLCSLRARDGRARHGRAVSGDAGALPV